MKPIFERLRLVLTILLLLIMADVSAQTVNAPFDVVVKSGATYHFSEFNDWQSQISDDPNNPVPRSPQIEASAAPQGGSVSVVANPNSQGVVTENLYMRFNWQLGNRTWNEVRVWKVKVSVDASYTLSSFYGKNCGSADAQITVPRFITGWYDNVGFVVGSPADIVNEKHGAIKMSFETTLEGLGGYIAFMIRAHAHTVAGCPVSDNASAEIKLNGVDLEIYPAGITVNPVSWYISAASGETANQIFIVQNAGSVPLLLKDFAVVGNTVPFPYGFSPDDLGSGCSLRKEGYLAPGADSCTIMINFEALPLPPGKNFAVPITATLKIESSDPDNPSLQVPLQATVHSEGANPGEDGEPGKPPFAPPVSPPGLLPH